MRGMVEAAIYTGYGSSDFVAYQCTATQIINKQQLKLTLQRQSGEQENRAFTIPALRRVYLTVHPEGGALIAIESGPLRILLRVLARNIDDWLAAIKTGSDEEDDDDEDVFAASTDMPLPEHKSQFPSITSTSSAAGDEHRDYGNTDQSHVGAGKSLRAGLIKPRHCSLDTGLESTMSACTPRFFLRQNSSYPDAFRDKYSALGDESINISREPSDYDGDIVTYV